MPVRARSLAERFAEHWMPEPNTGCWLWLLGGHRGDKGYGRIGLGPRGCGTIYAHRASWQLHRGEIPEGMGVLHRCDTPACVNPDHLFLGTNADNVADMVAKDRHAWRAHPRISESVIAQIRSLKGAVSQKCLAERFGVAPGYVSSLQAGKYRKDIAPAGGERP